MTGQRKIVISVIGGHECNADVECLALEIGKMIAEVGAILVCGGLGGVMQAASKGAHEAGGLTIGLLPGKDKADANPYIDVPLPTSIGYARNVMVACSADIIVALPGSNGTLCEICYGMVHHRPIIDLGGWDRPGMVKARDVKDAKTRIEAIMREIS